MVVAPSSDVLTKPEPDPAAWKVDHRSGKIAVATKVGAHAVVMGETEDDRNLCGSHQVLRVDSRRHHQVYVS